MGEEFHFRKICENLANILKKKTAQEVFFKKLTNFDILETNIFDIFKPWF